MPTYDYQCITCGKRFDVTQSIKADTLTHCLESICEQAEKGKGLVERVISGGSGVIYTGEGFYLTDYVHKPGSSKDKAAKAESGGTEKSKESSTSTSDSDSTSKDSSAAPRESGSTSKDSSATESATTQSTPTTTTPTKAPSPSPSTDK